MLSAYNVSEVIANYDGSGDSGDTNMYAVIPLSPESFDTMVHSTSAPNEVVAQNHVNNQPWDRLREQIIATKPPLMTPEMLDIFEDEIFALLPAGWEINDGSYGEIVIDIASEKITVESNERYTEVRSETHTY